MDRTSNKRELAIASVLGVLLLGALTWFALSSSTDQRADSSRAGVTSVPTDGDESALVDLPAADSLGGTDLATTRTDEVATHLERTSVASERDPDRPPPAIRGRVHNTAHRGLPEARVLAFEPHGGRARKLLAETRTDEDGAFQFENRSEEVLVVVEPEGFLPRWIRVEPDRFLEIEVFKNFPLTGRVLEPRTERALEGIRVEAPARWVDGERLRESQSTTTDAEGRFTLPFARSGKELTVTLKRAPIVPVRHEVLVNGSGEEVRLYFDPGGTHSIRTIAHVGDQPVAAAEVRLGGALAGETNEEGRLDLTLDASVEGQQRMLTAQVGRGVKTRVEWTPSTDDSVDLERIPILQGATVTGVVTDAEGKPIENARVSLAGSNKQRNLELPSGFSVTDGKSSDRTDASGRFTLSGLVPRRHPPLLFVRHEDFAPHRSKTFPLEVPGALVERDVRLFAGARMHGIARLDGDPISTTIRWESDSDRGKTISNDYGEYELTGLPPGEVRVFFEIPGRKGRGERTTKKEFVFLAPGEDLPYDLDVYLQTGLIAGRVTLSSGRALAGRRVLARLDSVRRSKLVIRTETDLEGFFELEVPLKENGTYRVTVDDGPTRKSVGKVEPGTNDLEFVFDELGKLWVQIADFHTGALIDDAKIHWRPSTPGAARNSWTYLADKNKPHRHGEGDRIALDLPLGTVDLLLDAHAKGYPQVEVLGLDVYANPRRAIPLRLEAGTRLEITFVDHGSGQPLGPRHPARKRPWVLIWEGLDGSGSKGLPDWARRRQFKLDKKKSHHTVVGVPPGPARLLHPMGRGKKLSPRRFEVTPTGDQKLTIRVGR